MLRVRIHHQSDDPSGFDLVWDKDLKESVAHKLLANFEQLKSDPFMQGEMLSLRVKDGEGGGFQINGCFLELEINRKDENRHVADVYFHADKWREW